jgi:anti-anti-sigma factor
MLELTKEPTMTAETPPDLIEVQPRDGVTVVRFLRRTILDPLAIEELGRRLTSLVREEGRTRLVLDCARVESLTSAMLGQFAALHVTISQAGGKMVFCNVGDFLRQILEVCKFPDAIPIHSDEEPAVRALTEAAPTV